jgi:hypothetical protein
LNELSIDEAPYRLAGMEPILEGAGLSYSRIGTHLRAELHARGAFYGVAYFVAAEDVFSFVGSQWEVEYARSKLWEQVCGKDHFELSPRRNLYLYVVGASEVIDDPKNLVARAHIVNDDRNYALKRVVTPEQARVWLQSPFEVLEGPARATEDPQLYLVLEPHERLGADPQDSALPAGLDVRHVLDYRHAEDRYDNPTIASQGTDAFWRHTEALFKRIMGLDYLLTRTEAGLSIRHQYNPRGAPLWQASRGERMAFALAHFLADASQSVKPGVCLAIHDVIAAFDTIRQLVVLDLLRDFVIATGASVQLKAAKSDFKVLAKAKFDLLKAGAT